MPNSDKKMKISKIYCEKCNSVFCSKKDYDKHLQIHSNYVCEECPIDTAISRLIRLFKKNN